MNYHEAFRGASSLGDALDIYQQTMDKTAALQAATLGQIVAVHTATIETEGVEDEQGLSRAAQTDITLELTAFRVLGQLQSQVVGVLDVVTTASQALTDKMSHTDRDLFRRASRLVEQGPDSAEFREFVRDAPADNKPALLAALDKPVADRLHWQADYLRGGVDTRAFIAGREQLSPQGKLAIWTSLDGAIFQQVQQHSTDFGVKSPITVDTLSRATEPAQPAIRAALDKDVWALMGDVHWQYSSQSVALAAVARQASHHRIGEILHSRLTGRPLPAQIIELSGDAGSQTIGLPPSAESPQIIELPSGDTER